jgi:hypothetical protein
LIRTGIIDISKESTSARFIVGVFFFMSESHPGFKAVADKIAHSEHIDFDKARAILASRSRKASPAAKKKNPRLNKVKK